MPMMAVSRLLKSCATPPASWPTACILVACATWRLRRFSSVVSARSQQHRHLAQAAHAGEAERDRLLRVGQQAHGDVAARRRALRKAAHAVGQRGLVGARDEVGRIGRQVPVARRSGNTGGAAEGGIGVKEAAVAADCGKPQRQAFDQRLELRRAAPRLLLPAAQADAALEQQHQARRLTPRIAMQRRVGERHLHHHLRRALAPFAGEEDLLTLVGTQLAREGLAPPVRPPRRRPRRVRRPDWRRGWCRRGRPAPRRCQPARASGRAAR